MFVYYCDIIADVGKVLQDESSGHMSRSHSHDHGHANRHNGYKEALLSNGMETAAFHV